MADSRVMLWDFDGTLAWRNGMWRGCLIEALTEIAPGHQLELDDLRTGLRGGFPWHRPDEQHVHLASPGAWWAALTPMLTRAYRLAGIDPRTAAAAADIVPTHFLNPPAWTVFPDTRPALTRLRDNSWRHVIVSNHVPELPQLVDALGSVICLTTS